MTIAPKLLKELTNTQGDVPQKLCANHAANVDLEKISVDEKTFRWMLNEDAMATEKLSEGIRNFAKDTIKLEKMLQKLTN